MIVNKFVMAYGVEHDRLRAILPDGFVSLRPVLRIDAEASPTGAVGETEIFRAAEPVSANKEFCDCSFRWKNSACGAHGRSSGRTIPAYPSDVRTIYPKSGFNVENAARIPCEQVLGSYTVRIER